jgi:hypothetical protein
MMKKWWMFIGLAAVCVLQAFGGLVDSVQFGDEASEKAHALEAELSETVEGELGEPARRLLTHGEWRGGKFTFILKVDPEKPNYFTAKFWGGDTCGEEQHESRLCLYVDGLQLGTRHLGAIDMLDIVKYGQARYPGRFLYTTRPLPIHMTKGKTEIELTIEGQGGINGYASDIYDYQKMMSEPSRPVYGAYTHTTPCFQPPDDEVQGAPPANVPVRPEPGEEIIEQLKQELNKRSDQELARGGKKHVYSIQYLAYAYFTEWNTAYKNPQVLERVVEAIDAHVLEFIDDPKTVEGERWIHKGPIGDAVRLLHKELEPYLKQEIPGTDVRRYKGWAEMLVASRYRNSKGRRSYTNQCMIKDLNTYYCDLAVRLIYPSRAWSETKALRLLHEAIGLEPFSGNWNEDGEPEWNHGRNKMLLTEKGLTKELGFVGAYGEIISDSGAAIYEATKSSPRGADPRIRDQLIKMIRARAPFRYPLIDKDGYRSMNLEAVIGWRDWKYPGPVVYDQMNGRDGGAFDVAVATGDKVLLAYGQQMLEDNQFFASIKARMGHRSTNSKTYLLGVPGRYELVASLPSQSRTLPMTDGHPDFVFSDPGNGLLAFKDRGNVFYASLYWRSRHAVNNLARVHYMTPYMERDSIVNIDTVFEDSGEVFTIPDQTNQEFGRGRAESWYADQDIHQAMAGVELPIAKVRGDDSFVAGQEHIQAGKAQLYTLSYGPYFIAMNCDTEKRFAVEIPSAFSGAKDLVTGEIAEQPEMRLKPGEAVVLCSTWNVEPRIPRQYVAPAPPEPEVKEEAPVVVEQTPEVVTPEPLPVPEPVEETPLWEAWLTERNMTIGVGVVLLMTVMIALIKGLKK